MALPLDKGARRLLRHASRLTRSSNPTLGSSRSCLPMKHWQTNTAQRTTRLYSTSPPNPNETKPHPARWKPTSRSNFAILGGLLTTILSFVYFTQPVLADSSSTPDSDSADTRDPSLPRHRLSDIRKHDADHPNPWVTYEDKVYDITDWIPAHPGGEVILRAAGGSIDRYWDIFSIHKQEYVRQILDSYLIGYVHAADLVDGKLPQAEIEDPFVADPARDPRLVVMTDKPRNAETPLDALTDYFITPMELFYVRNHMWVPTVAKSARGNVDHVVTVELPDGETKSYTVRDLKAKFPHHKVTATLQCSGNRRKNMTAAGHDTKGIQWNVGAISTAEWEGAKLSDVLRDAGFPVDEFVRDGRVQDKDHAAAKHVWFAGLEAYGSSIPLETALDPRADVLLAYRMNGVDLLPDHGFPLRALVPGTVAARSVKWLSKITLSDEESPSQWQRRDYKCFGPNEGSKANWEKAVAIQEMPVTSAITAVRHRTPTGDEFATGHYMTTGDGQTRTKGDTVAVPATVHGYAFSGGGRKIVRVDVSVDNGQTWDQAKLIDDCAPREGQTESPCKGRKTWAWQRWTYDAMLPMDEKKGDKRLSHVIVKAVDEAYNTQPESHAGIYNPRGNLATAWHRIVMYDSGKKEDYTYKNPNK